MVFQASDIITVDAGGREYKTSVNTLISSGSGFFEAMLGSTGAALRGVAEVTPRASKRQRADDDSSNSPNDQVRSIFVDCDPDVFADVLYFMRRNTLPPELETDFARLKKLRTEAEFFVYDALIQACSDQLEALNSIAKASLEEEKPKTARFYTSVICRDDFEHHIEVEEGSVMYIDSVVLAGDCKVKRYNSSEEADDAIPDCYIDCAREDTGDFQLGYRSSSNQDPDDDTVAYCLAHVGLDQIHIEDHAPMNVDFRQELRFCFKPEKGHSTIRLFATGADWHVHYWIGPPEAIPPLMMSRAPQSTPSKQKKMVRAAKQAIKKSKENELLLAAMVALLASA
jgi:hypothetical protein